MCRHFPERGLYRCSSSAEPSLAGRDCKTGRGRSRTPRWNPPTALVHIATDAGKLAHLILIARFADRAQRRFNRKDLRACSIAGGRSRTTPTVPGLSPVPDPGGDRTEPGVDIELNAPKNFATEAQRHRFQTVRSRIRVGCPPLVAVVLCCRLPDCPPPVDRFANPAIIAELAW